ncbi:MAG: spermidine synthase, partial [Rubrivivax sp.]|nr:spermidine synthase [Rubrivivax sp.]
VIVSDNFHPARSGAASLYTVEHFAAVRERLAPGGLFCQWLPLHQLDLATLRSIVRSFLAAFPDGRALLATYSLETPVLGLIATPDGTGFDLARLRQRLSAGAAAAMAPDFGLDDEWALLGTFVAGPGELAAFAVEAPLNIDDHPVVAHQAARFWYRRDSTPRSRLFELLDRLAIAPGDVLRPPIRPEDARRLADHWRARDLYLRAGRDVKPAADARAMLAQVRAPLLEVLRTAPDFRPAYDPLLRLARAVAAEDPAAARDLLAELARIQPARPEAPALLRQLDPAASGR